MFLTEYDEEKILEMERQEGCAEGILIAIHELLDSMKWPAKQARDALKIFVCEVVSGSSKAMGELSDFWDDFLPEQVYNDIVL